MVDAQTIGVLVTTASVTVAAIYYMFTLRINMRTQQLALKAQEQNLETRQAQLFMPIYAKMYDPDFIEGNAKAFGIECKDFDDFNSKCSYESNPDLYRSFWSLGWYMEGLGVLVKRGLISPELVDDLMSGTVIAWWERFEPMISGLRTRNPSAAENVEYTYRMVKQIAVSEHPEIMERRVEVT
ncbi:MAG: hypothetical protein ABSA11_15605 [Candidatus Bathyarchaeia archaeon]|jgi:hypothetical protein